MDSSSDSKNLPTDLQAMERGGASDHICGGGWEAGKGPGWLWPGMEPNSICSGGGEPQQGELHSVRSHLVPSVGVTVLIKAQWVLMKWAQQQDTAFYAHLRHRWLRGLGHIPQPLCPGNHPSLHPFLTLFSSPAHTPLAVQCLQEFGYVSLGPGTAQGTSVAAISLIISFLPLMRLGGSCWTWLKLTDKELSCMKTPPCFHSWYPHCAISQSAQAPLPPQSCILLPSGML